MLCPICNKMETQEGNDECCLFCFKTGRYFEKVLASDERSNLLTRIRAIEGVVDTAVWHEGVGGFIFGIYLKDGRILTPAAWLEDVFGAGIVPMIPAVGDPWRIVVHKPNEEMVIVPDDIENDDDLVRTLESMLSLETAAGM